MHLLTVNNMTPILKTNFVNVIILARLQNLKKESQKQVSEGLIDSYISLEYGNNSALVQVRAFISHAGGFDIKMSDYK